MSTREYRAAVKGESWKFRLMNTIDDCMKYARTREEFIFLMKSEDYGVRWDDSRQNITYTLPSGYKCRDDRLHDEKYLKENMEHEFGIRQRLINGGIEEPEYAGEAAGAKYASGASHRTGVVRADDDDQRDLPYDSGAGRPRGGAKRAGDRSVQFDGELVQPSQRQPDMDAGDGAAGGIEEDSRAARTGWEKERADLFAPQVQAAAAAPVPSVVSADPNLSGIAGDLVQLGHALERNQNSVPVRDATTTPTRHERGKKRKLAPGQKADDHEDEQTFQQTMY